MRILKWGLLASFLWMCGTFINLLFFKPPGVEAPEGPRPQRDLIANSGYDGSVYQVERYIGTQLEDPDSLEFEQWYPVKQFGEFRSVRVKFRARNGFGGYQRLDWTCFATIDGEQVRCKPTDRK